MFTRIPWTVAVITFVLTAAGTAGHGGFSAPHVLLALVAALVTCIGAALAPIAYSSGKLTSSEQLRRKSIQFVIAGVVTVLGTCFFSLDPAVAAVAGIAGALFVGAVLPQSERAGQG